MAKLLINDTTLTAIADAIRAKTESTDLMLPGEMAGLIETFQGGASYVTGSFTPASEKINTNPVTITGLPSKPKFVIIYLKPLTTKETSGTLHQIFALGYENAAAESVYLYTHAELYSGRVQAYVDEKTNKDYKIELNATGFTWKALANYAYQVYAAQYNYIAIF